MEKLLWMIVCFGIALVVLRIMAIALGIAVTAAPARTENERAPEKNVWTIIAEKVLGWFDKLIGLLLSDDAPRSKRLTALGLMLIILGGLCLAGGVYGISVVGTASTVKTAAQIASLVEFA